MVNVTYYEVGMLAAKNLEGWSDCNQISHCRSNQIVALRNGFISLPATKKNHLVIRHSLKRKMFPNIKFWQPSLAKEQLFAARCASRSRPQKTYCSLSKHVGPHFKSFRRRAFWVAPCHALWDGLFAWHAGLQARARLNHRDCSSLHWDTQLPELLRVQWRAS